MTPENNCQVTCCHTQLFHFLCKPVPFAEIVVNQFLCLPGNIQHRFILKKIGTASFTGPKASFFGFFLRLKIGHIFSERRSRLARRMAIYANGFYSIKKFPVIDAVAINCSLPHFIICISHGCPPEIDISDVKYNIVVFIKSYSFSRCNS
ncbi:hypothetical protein DOT_5053 [Desulfosporosinus sp. OT]|nr:hypothetical protein DOT_5053 [Desulfosporosinus sp. OT]